ncbi:Uncharacterised protein [Vibrio cholerae]|nr:Uncharacterised protein [Vibrio cholerae]
MLAERAVEVAAVVVFICFYSFWEQEISRSAFLHIFNVCLFF